MTNVAVIIVLKCLNKYIMFNYTKPVANGEKQRGYITAACALHFDILWTVSQGDRLSARPFSLEHIKL